MVEQTELKSDADRWGYFATRFFECFEDSPGFIAELTYYYSGPGGEPEHWNIPTNFESLIFAASNLLSELECESISRCLSDVPTDFNQRINHLTQYPLEKWMYLVELYAPDLTETPEFEKKSDSFTVKIVRNLA